MSVALSVEIEANNVDYKATFTLPATIAAATPLVFEVDEVSGDTTTPLVVIAYGGVSGETTDVHLAVEPPPALTSNVPGLKSATLSVNEGDTWSDATKTFTTS